MVTIYYHSAAVLGWLLVVDSRLDLGSSTSHTGPSRHLILNQNLIFDFSSEVVKCLLDVSVFLGTRLEKLYAVTFS